MVGTKTIFRPAFFTFSMARSFFLPQRFAARAPVDVVADAVELQVESVQPGFLGALGELQVHEFQAIGRYLRVGEAHFLGQPEYVQESRVDGRLAARKLHDPARHRLLVAQGLQHLPHGLEIRLVEVAGGVGVGETHRAGHIAPVGQIQVRETRVAGVQVAQAAIVRAIFGGGHRGVGQPAAVAELPFLHLQVQSGVGIDDVAKLAVGRATLLHHHFAGILKYPGVNELRTFRTERPGGLRQTLLERPDGGTRIGSFRLDYLKLRHAGNCKQAFFERLQSGSKV